MIEIKLSQGAKPRHAGGLLLRPKITRSTEIIEARKLIYPPTRDCHSPSAYSAFKYAPLIPTDEELLRITDGQLAGTYEHGAIYW
mmetsp:Transcript_12266/g.20322  ORF Transcript_12266/g.20322 Transcript_12266/m.20322 type:complete len:85 (+) Transcript_12266:13-267(+)